MRRSGRVSAVGRAHLHEVDPTAVWIVAGDLHRLPEWTPVEKVEWGGDLPSVGDFMAITMRLGVRRHRLNAKVTEWQAGRQWILELEGLPWTTGAQLEFHMDSEVESGVPSAPIEFRYRAEMPTWLAPTGEGAARRRLDRALRHLAKLVT